MLSIREKFAGRGFTLVELLVVVAIIAVLAVVGVTVFANVQVNARDARRRADLDALSKALEANFNQTASTYGLGPSMFTVNKVPVESKTGHPAYCFYYSASRTDTRGANPATAWTAATCPDLTGVTGVTKTDLSATTTVSGMVWWKLCMVLESGSAVICKNNTQ